MSNAPMVVSDSPIGEKKQRSYSWDAGHGIYLVPNDAQYQYPASSMHSHTAVPFISAPMPPMQQYSNPYQSGYVQYNSGAFPGGHSAGPVHHLAAFGSFNPNVYMDHQYRYTNQQAINTGLGINSHFSVPNSPVSLTYPTMVNQAVVLTPPASKIRKDKPRDASGLPRGPPRKPKQSGHAIWVGSLPVDTSVIALKDHFADGFTSEIESVFVILKSNCAFINYATETVCRDAVKKFHGSRFAGAVLSCRIQKSPINEIQEDSAFPELEKKSPLPSRNDSENSLSPTLSGDSDPLSKAATEMDDDQKTMVDDEKQEESEKQEEQEDKYFIIKSLSIQDLVLSVRFGMWTTQSHNEEALNKAFKIAKNVYLIFSANKSREYFGYARMISPVADDGSSILQSLTTENNTKDTPKTTSTPATPFAPAGRVFEDAFRGTLFWESDLNKASFDSPTDSGSGGQGDVPFGGKPFGVAWLSTTRVPFTRTRGLRNAWNSNKEVKVARDGTELETNVGRHLVGLFHEPCIKRRS